MLSFLPLMSIEGDIALENTIKYFLVQRIASVFFLTNIIIMSFRAYSIIEVGTLLAIIMKLGAAPLHGWFISLLKNSRARIIFYLSTTQKFIPLMIVTNFKIEHGIFNLIGLTTMLVVCFNGIRILFLNKILGLSSINNLLWILLRSQIDCTLMIIFFCFYSFMLLSVLSVSIKQMGLVTISQLIWMPKFTRAVFTFYFISLGGLPPFLGFVSKALVLKRVVEEFSTMFLIMLTFSSLMILLYYIIFSMFMLTYTPEYKPNTHGVYFPPVQRIFFCTFMISPDLIILGGL